ncbi:transcriptional regulator [Pseudomonas putida]|uniref:Transcriptional regulator n=1 Tax=Pseudomonas putida TaxID=303 RepID=A0A2S3X379_PSEPU|nr:helix-turn-helix domain-containing protein [Pseudomonas putida]POG09933.1 transcriptional regulator [Pseudomonas putida]POG16077.1 transcriptional regulator [Pseudomonas putida]
MKGLGPRLREERERLGMTQRVFGDIGGVEPNAQGKYESGERTPRADYLAALANQGVDALYVLSGERTPAPLESLTADESGLLSAFRRLPAADKAALWHLLGRLVGESSSSEQARQPRHERRTFLKEVLR